MSVLYPTFKVSGGLPAIAAVDLPDIGTVFVIQGESYYYRAAKGIKADTFNRMRRITKVQAECMMWGLVAGWHSPGANPANYDREGRFISKERVHRLRISKGRPNPEK